MSAAIRLEVAREKIAEMSDAKLTSFADSDEVWRLAHQVGVPQRKLELLILRERFSRGHFQAADLPPHCRRDLVTSENLNLHAIAAGPIMRPGEIYCPLGKLSMEETKRREAAQVQRLA
jgi:hypothetical protein